MAERPIMAGIAGPSCSGKTTTAKTIERRFGSRATRVSFDNYDRYPSGSPQLAELLKQGPVVNWENPDLFDMVRFLSDMQRLKEGLPIEVRPLSRESMAAGEEVRIVEPGEITIVEGLLIFHDPEARELFDLRFYAGISHDEMVRRRLATRANNGDPWDDPEYINGPMIEGTKQFVEPQKRHVHVAIDGAIIPTEKFADTIVNLVEGRIRAQKTSPPHVSGENVPLDPGRVAELEESIRLHKN